MVLEEAGFSDAFLDIRNASNVSIDSFGDFFNQTFATPSRDDHQNQISHSISGGSGNCKPVEALLERMMDMIVALGEGQDKLHNKMDKFLNHYQQLEKVNTDLLQKIKNLEAKLCKQNPSKTLSSCSSDSDSSESNSESSDSDGNDSSSCDDVPYTTIKSRKKLRKARQEHSSLKSNSKIVVSSHGIGKENHPRSRNSNEVPVQAVNKATSTSTDFPIMRRSADSHSQKFPHARGRSTDQYTRRPREPIMDSPKSSQRRDYHTRRPRAPPWTPHPKEETNVVEDLGNPLRTPLLKEETSIAEDPGNPLRTPLLKEETSIAEDPGNPLRTPLLKEETSIAEDPGNPLRSPLLKEETSIAEDPGNPLNTSLPKEETSIAEDPGTPLLSPLSKEETSIAEDQGNPPHTSLPNEETRADVLETFT